MKGDPEFVILKYQAWMDASEFEDLILGAIVKEPLSPSTNYVPDSPSKYRTHEHQKGFATDFILTKAGDMSKELAASLKSIGGCHVIGNIEESVHLAGKFIRYKRIQQLDQFWAKLKDDADVKKTVPEWISIFKPWIVCLVVGIMICEDVELSIDGAQSRTYGGNVELPIGQAALAAGILNPAEDLVDPQVKLVSTKQATAIFKSRMGKSSIFAVELKRVTTEVFKHRVLQLKNKGPEMDSTRLASEESDEEEDLYKPVNVEDLILDDFGLQDFKDIVG